MEASVFNMALLIVFGSWLVFIPKHLVFIFTKYQLLLFKYLPISHVAFKNEKEAKTPIFNERAVRAIGFANYIGAVVIATKISW
ncbi:MAG: hypothetical protein ABJH06_01720 [Paraglaciecola sp.]|uniref:hypothetical protein n=1 Tax=Paraglaciecola sp. TaxID=1920173 RepID=UPI003267BDA3